MAPSALLEHQDLPWLTVAYTLSVLVRFAEKTGGGPIKARVG